MDAVLVVMIVIIAVLLGALGGVTALSLQLGDLAKNPTVIQETRKAYETATAQTKEMVQLVYGTLSLAERLAKTVVPASPITDILDKGEDVLRAIVDPMVEEKLVIIAQKFNPPNNGAVGVPPSTDGANG